MKIAKILSLAVLSSAVVFTSCKKDDDSPNNPSNPSNSTAFKVRMTDSPGNFSAFNTTVTKVEAYVENEGWITLDSTAQNMSILDLTNGSEEEIANDNSAMVGHYTMLRLTMGNQSTLTTNDQSGNNTYTLNWNGSSDNTVTVMIDANVQNGSTTSVLLDFNAGASILSDLTGGYSLTPVITWVEDENSGVRGDVNGAVRGMVTLSNGVNSYSTYLANDGRFLIRGVENGTYTMTIDGQASANSSTSTMQQSNVVVVDGQITNMGTINFE